MSPLPIVDWPTIEVATINPSSTALLELSKVQGLINKNFEVKPTDTFFENLNKLIEVKENDMNIIDYIIMQIRGNPLVKEKFKILEEKNISPGNEKLTFKQKEWLISLFAFKNWYIRYEWTFSKIREKKGLYKYNSPTLEEFRAGTDHIVMPVVELKEKWLLWTVIWISWEWYVALLSPKWAENEFTATDEWASIIWNRNFPKFPWIEWPFQIPNDTISFSYTHLQLEELFAFACSSSMGAAMERFWWSIFRDWFMTMITLGSERVNTNPYGGIFYHLYEILIENPIISIPEDTRKNLQEIYTGYMIDWKKIDEENKEKIDEIVFQIWSIFENLTVQDKFDLQKYFWDLSTTIFTYAEGIHTTHQEEK